MLIRVQNILGIGSIPKDRTAAVNWLKKNAVSIEVIKDDGRQPAVVRLTDLPETERLAYLRQELDDLHLDPGLYDDVAHEAYMAAPSKKRGRAEHKAAIACMLTSLGQEVIWSEKYKLVQEKFGKKGNSLPNLKKLWQKIQGIEPINYAPVLLDGYKGPDKRIEIPPDAWRFFMTMIRDAAPEWPISEAYFRVKEAGKVLGWDVPSYATFRRRWLELSEAQRLEARYGKKEAEKRLRMPAQRDKTTIGSMEWVSLDGRTMDFWVDWGDGKAVRPTLIILVDSTSNVVLGWELAQSENAAATKRLIKRVCEKFGIIDILYPDNGRAFAGNEIAGGSDYRFRFGTENQKVNAMGICAAMGIKLHFTKVENAQAKPAERVYATISRTIDDGPEFKDAHAGHSPGTSPTEDIKPIPVEKAIAILRRTIHNFNTKAGRRSQGANGRSYWQVFEEGFDRRKTPLRRPTAQQLYCAGLTWKLVSVDRFGQVWVDGWGYGGPDTQTALLPYARGKSKNPNGGVKINLGRDPDNFNAPAIAYDMDGEFICQEIEPIKRGAYDSADGIRDQNRKIKAAKADVKAANSANDYLDDVAYRKAMAALDVACCPPENPELPPQKVIGGQFKSPLKAKPKPEGKTGQMINPDFYRNMGTALEAKKARAGK